MAPDCDISVLDGLKYVSRFGIPLKKYWKTGQKAPNIPQLYKYRIADYESIGNHTATIKYMLRQFPLICDAYLSDTIYDYKDGIYTYEMNRQGENLELHAMVLVGWGYSDGGEVGESVGDKSSESSGELEESDEDADERAEEGSGEDEESNEDREVKHYYNSDVQLGG
ncbi:hypothetical protein ACFX1X_029250 [Malus domestica]|uniref:Peptidase C1A papain C-terminal domain-containing protein n=1 Tax=Malus domestica TaxID=3750 RepID=A0A498K6R3_MALDO|nr:hypothetical protein DVH24_038233 [Malus domestica]